MYDTPVRREGQQKGRENGAHILKTDTITKDYVKDAGVFADIFKWRTSRRFIMLWR